MIEAWDAIEDAAVVSERNGSRTLELGRAFANEFPIRVVCEVLGFPKEARRKQPTWLYDEAGNPISKDIISKLCETKVDGDFLSTEEITSKLLAEKGRTELAVNPEVCWVPAPAASYPPCDCRGRNRTTGTDGRPAPRGRQRRRTNRRRFVRR